MADTVKDPVCGMEVRPDDAAATEVHEGRTFYFCSHACHDTFVKDPHRYGHPAEEHSGHSLDEATAARRRALRPRAGKRRPRAAPGRPREGFALRAGVLH